MRAGLAAALVLALACGVKAPPRPPERPRPSLADAGPAAAPVEPDGGAADGGAVPEPCPEADGGCLP